MLSAQTRLPYPAPPRSNQIDDYHDLKTADPYRTLEDADSPATQKWVERENALTASVLAKVPNREAIGKQLSALWNYEKFGGIYKAGTHYFYARNSGLQNQAVIWTMDSLNATPRVFLDPNTYRADGTAALAAHSPSSTGRYYAYAIAQAGSDWRDWHVREVATGKDLPDLIRWDKDSTPTWLPDDTGFYYARYPEPPAAELLTAPALNQKVYFHKIGTQQSADKLIYERPDQPTWSLFPYLPESSRYLMIVIFAGVDGKNGLAWLDTSSPATPPTLLFPKAELGYTPFAATGSLVYMRTTDTAPRGRIVAIDLLHPERANWKQIVAESADTLDEAQLVDGKLLLSYMKDAHSTARLAALTGTPLSEIQLPGLGTAGWSPAQLHDKEAFYTFSGHTVPPGSYRLDLTTGRSSPVRQSKVAFEAAAFETKQVFYPSKDGTRIPMFLSYRKGLKLDGNNPVLLYGYGGFNVAETPYFSVIYAQWMQMGGVFASANLRGGSEYGEEWHKAGMLGKKQNVFDDFIAAAEWLIANKYTSTPKLAIYGGSNGGLLVGAVLNQRPGLFGAAMPDVGVMDMLRFNRFGFGTQWVGEYGDPGKPDDFKVLRAYSPLHNIRKGVAYPPTLITTADHDDRVMPGHSLKYTATLQQAQQGNNPILIRVETRAGHGAGKPTSKLIDEWTDRFAFLTSVLKLSEPRP